MNQESPVQRVALLRNQLFLPSETFITEQARFMRRFRPLLVGRLLSGKPSTEVDFLVPPSRQSFDALRYVLLRRPKLILDLLRGQPIKLLHAHFGVEGVYGMPIAEQLGLPLVTTFHGFDATLGRAKLTASGKPAWINYALGISKLSKVGSLFICVSKFIQDRILQRGFPSDRTVVHHIGVDTASFPPNAEDPERPLVLHVARLVEKKGTEYLLKAFAAVSARFPAARLAIIGTGPLKEQLTRLAGELGIASRVEWLGVQPHDVVKRWMKSASVFCLPSCTARNGDSEGLSTVVVEASASGIPVLSTYHAGIPEAVIEGQTGFLVQEREVDSLAAALERLLASYPLRRTMGDEARRFVTAEFNIARQTEILEELYADLI